MWTEHYYLTGLKNQYWSMCSSSLTAVERLLAQVVLACHCSHLTDRSLRLCLHSLILFPSRGLYPSTLIPNEFFSFWNWSQIGCNWYSCRAKNIQFLTAKHLDLYCLENMLFTVLATKLTHRREYSASVAYLKIYVNSFLVSRPLTSSTKASNSL